jgi:hypothetical protein
MQRIHHLDDIRRSAIAQRQLARQSESTLRPRLSRGQRLQAKSYSAGLREEAANRLLTIYDRSAMDAHLTWLRITGHHQRQEIDRDLEGDVRLYAAALLNSIVSTCIVSAVSLGIERLRHKAFVGFPAEVSPPPHLDQNRS